MNEPVTIRPRSLAALLLASVVGVLAFGWPLVISAQSALAHSTDAPFVFALLLPLCVVIVLAELSEGGIDAKAVAILGLLATLGAALRPLGAGAGGIETVFFLLILGGRVFGPGFGFVLGAVTLFASALLTGGVGPWLPYQMLGAAWVGTGAGLLPRARGRAELVLLVVYGAVSALLYGLVMNLSFWPFSTGVDTGLSFLPGASAGENLRRFGAFAVATSLGWDLGRAVTNVGLLLVVGPAVLATLRRASRRARFHATPVFERSHGGASRAGVDRTRQPVAGGRGSTGG